jgi:hypothetical protein
MHQRGVLVFALALSMVTALVFGWSPRLLCEPRALGALSPRSRDDERARRAASALVVVEVALAIVLLMGAALSSQLCAPAAVDPDSASITSRRWTSRCPDRYKDPAALRLLGPHVPAPSVARRAEAAQARCR